MKQYCSLIFLILIFCSFQLLSFGQNIKLQKLTDKADKLYMTEKYEQAKKVYGKILKIDSTDACVVYRYEACNFQIPPYNVNCKNLFKAQKMGYDVRPEILFFYKCIPSKTND